MQHCLIDICSAATEDGREAMLVHLAERHTALQVGQRLLDLIESVDTQNEMHRITHESSFGPHMGLFQIRTDSWRKS